MFKCLKSIIQLYHNKNYKNKNTKMNTLIAVNKDIVPFIFTLLLTTYHCFNLLTNNTYLKLTHLISTLLLLESQVSILKILVVSIFFTIGSACNFVYNCYPSMGIFISCFYTESFLLFLYSIFSLLMLNEQSVKR